MELFRPLAGVNYNGTSNYKKITDQQFPSPCGGEL